MSRFQKLVIRALAILMKMNYIPANAAKRYDEALAREVSAWEVDAMAALEEDS